MTRTERRPLRVAFHGTSIMAQGTWVERLRLSLQVAWPTLDLRWDNRGTGGATSREVLADVQVAPGSDLAFLGCGTNDVWRGFQGRDDEAVDVEEYASNLRRTFAALRVSARRAVLVTETPFGWDPEDSGIDVGRLNEELTHFSSVAKGIARDEGAEVVDVRPRFVEVARGLTGGLPPSPADPALWEDGVHLNALGDTLLARLVEDHLHRSDLLVALLA